MVSKTNEKAIHHNDTFTGLYWGVLGMQVL